MAKIIQIEEYLKLREEIPVIDVRSPAEYSYACIPGAINIPLFENDERALVGKRYKNDGKKPAILLGLKIVGPKLEAFARKSSNIAKNGKLLVYCWRGGMRSKSMAWLFETVGVECYILDGGYKTYRNRVLSEFTNDFKIIVIGGMTGSGKTDVIKSLRNKGEQIIDLEGMAHHKGSAFGALGESEQPSVEYFENILFEELKLIDRNKTLWLEDESHAIGSVYIPHSFFLKMRESRIIKIEMAKNLRVERLFNDYAGFDNDELISSIKKIQKRLGGLSTKTAIDSIEKGDLKTAISISLDYYDKTYNFGISKRPVESVFPFKVNTINADDIASQLLKKSKELNL